MRFNCEKTRLSEAVGTVSKAASVKSTISALEGIKGEVKDGIIKLSAYDFSMAICSTIEVNTVQNGTIIFPAKLFGDILRKLPNDIVYIESDENYHIKIECAGATFNIMGVSPEDFPQIPEISDESHIDLSISAFKRLVRQTVYAASTLDNKPILTGIFFEINDAESSISAVGLDQNRLALKKENFEYKFGDIKNFIIPARTLNELLKILPEESNSNIQISVSGKNVMFVYENFIFISRTLEGEFLNYKNVIPKESKLKIKINTHDMRAMLDRAALITSNAIKSPIRCDFDFDSIKISTASNVGNFSDTINIQNCNSKMTIGFNNKYMFEALSACDEEEVIIKLGTELSPILIEPVSGNGFMFIVMPMRLNLELK